MTIKKLKGLVNGNKNKNIRVVKIRENRVCKYCSNILKKGTECLTVNKKNESRYWICGDCVNKITNYHEAKASLDAGCIPFDDEGYYMACQDYLAECESECEEIGYFDEDDYFGEE